MTHLFGRYKCLHALQAIRKQIVWDLEIDKFSRKYPHNKEKKRKNITRQFHY